MNRKLVERLTRELFSVLEQVIEHQETLHGLIREKLDAMRRNDTAGMMSASQREGRIAAQVSALDARRGEVVDRLCEALSLPRPSAPGRMTLRVLAQALEIGARAHLVSVGQRLREQRLKIAGANRVVELVCREMLDYFKTLFSALTLNDDGSDLYSRGGSRAADARATVLDAVG